MRVGTWLETGSVWIALAVPAPQRSQISSVLVTSNARETGAWELYDLSRDRSETRDVRDEHPDAVGRLVRAWQRGAEETDVLPWPEERGHLRRIPWPPE